MTTTKPKPRRAALPDGDTALRQLAVGHARAVFSLLLRLLSAGFLIALLTIQLPAVRRALPLANAVGVALVAWPFFTSMGRLYGWRIALGRRCAEANQWEDAVRTLTPLVGMRATLFDAGGEGRYHLALALQHLGRDDEAQRQWREIANQYARSEWGRKSASALLPDTPDTRGTSAPPAA